MKIRVYFKDNKYNNLEMIFDEIEYDSNDLIIIVNGEYNFIQSKDVLRFVIF